jgi:hypothetical protein
MKTPVANDTAEALQKDISNEPSRPVDTLSPVERRKLIHRIDRRLIVTTGIMYCISLMDRTNLGSAYIAGMSQDLQLSVWFRYVS